MHLTLREIAEATTGALTGGPPDEVATSFTIDSRGLEAGACFVAVRGNRDGHDFVSDAFRRGAAVALVAHRPSDVHDRALVLVADPLVALGDLGRLARGRLAGATVVGVTGSAGKTSTKDLTAAALRRRMVVRESPGSFNNESGLPLTLLGADPTTEVIVAEMGARFEGNIRHLCEIARPNVGVVTHVGLAHAEHLEGPDGIARVKGELVDALPASGLAVLNADDEATPALTARVRAHVLTVGLDAHRHPDVLVGEVRLDPELRAAFALTSPWGSGEIRLGVRGHHQAVNAAMAATVALHLGVPFAEVCAGLAEATSASWRMQLERSPGGVVVLNDAYNASPTSMTAALQSFAHLPVTGHRIAVIGEMLELGTHADREHERVGELAAASALARLVVVGPGARAIAKAARRVAPELSVDEVDDTDGVLALLGGALGAGDAVLVKASRALGLERAAAALAAGVGDRVRAPKESSNP